MSKKVAIFISAILFAVLMVLFYWEIKDPEAGSTLLYSMFK